MRGFTDRDVELLQFVKSKGMATKKDILENFNGDNDYVNRLDRFFRVQYVKMVSEPKDSEDNGDDCDWGENALYSLTDECDRELIDFLEFQDKQRAYINSQNAHDLAVHTLPCDIKRENVVSDYKNLYEYYLGELSKTETEQEKSPATD